MLLAFISKQALIMVKLLSQWKITLLSDLFRPYICNVIDPFVNWKAFSWVYGWRCTYALPCWLWRPSFSPLMYANWNGLFIDLNKPHQPGSIVSIHLEQLAFTTVDFQFSSAHLVNYSNKIIEWVERKCNKGVLLGVSMCGVPIPQSQSGLWV